MDSRILKKIRQCLTLAKSATNQHEAAAAMKAAQRLMKKHRVTDEDLDFSFVQAIEVETESKQFMTYHAQLLHFIKHAFGIEFFVSGRNAQDNFVVTFIGINPQAELAQYCYEVLYAKLIKDRAAFVKAQSNRCKRATKVARGDRYAEGWVFGVHQAIEAFALTLSEQDVLTRYKAKYHPDLVDKKPTTRGKKANTSNAAARGFRQGQQQSIHRPVNGQEQAKLEHS